MATDRLKPDKFKKFEVHGPKVRLINATSITDKAVQRIIESRTVATEKGTGSTYSSDWAWTPTRLLYDCIKPYCHYCRHYAFWGTCPFITISPPDYGKG